MTVQAPTLACVFILAITSAVASDVDKPMCNPCVDGPEMFEHKNQLADVPLAVSRLDAEALDSPCWLSDDYTGASKTTDTAILRTYLLQINLEDPKGDAEARIAHGDFRLIGIGGFGIFYPGIEDNNLVCVLGARYIQGTTDVVHSKEHMNLQSSFEKYAKRYNEIIISHHHSTNGGT